MSMVRFTCAFMTMIGVIQSCGKNKEANVRAASQIRSSFHITKNFIKKSSQLSIQKDALEKEFLLQGSLMIQPVIPMFNGLKSRIVAFKRSEDKVYMLEASQGHGVTTDLPQTLVLASFPVTAENDQEIFFDFNAGMSRTFLGGDWSAQDLAGGDYKPEWNSVNLPVSFIEDMTFDDQNNVVIDQTARAFLTAGTNQEVPLKVRYYLSPYKINPNFKPTKSENFDRMGFFEANPILEKGKSVVYASKFDVTKPVVFYVSSNTPDKYKQAVKEGVLYWNKAFGREVLQAKDAPAGVVAPNFNYNIIQWVNWDEAGFAYADAQMDPRTGEILHAQIFLTSVFALSGKDRAKFLVKKLKDQQKNHYKLQWNQLIADKISNDSKKEIKSNKEIGTILNKFLLKDQSKENHTSHEHLHFSIAKMENEHLCTHEFHDSFIQTLENLLSTNPNISDEVLEKIAIDYVRDVVAHEVGHTLGLRHNFAGSLSANYPEQAKDGLYKQYITEGHTPAGVFTTSSVMDYQRFEESTLSGDLILNHPTAFDYDDKAIKTLYFGKQYTNEEIPLFCTDSHVATFIDCQRFDAGASLVDHAKWLEQNELENLPYRIIGNYLTVKKSEHKNFSLGTLDLVEASFQLYSGRVPLIKMLSKDSKFLKIHRSFDRIHSLNSEDVLELENLHREAQLLGVGGMDEVLNPISKAKLEASLAKSLQLLDEEAKFTLEEKAVISLQIKLFYKKLPKSLKLVDFMIGYLVTKNLSEADFVNGLAEKLAKKVESILLDSEESLRTQLNFNDATVEVVLPKFIYDNSLRFLGSQMLQGKTENLVWGRKERLGLKAEFEQVITSALQTLDTISIIDVDQQSPQVAKWILENRAIYYSYVL